MQRAENIIGATSVVTCLLYVRQLVDPATLFSFAFAVAVCGVTSSHSELHGYKFRWSVLGPAIMPCVLLVTAGMSARCLWLGLVVVWIMRSAMVGFWCKLALIGVVSLFLVVRQRLASATLFAFAFAVAGCVVTASHSELHVYK